jgi:N-acetylglucosaminyldiphosphoundecaprenol N-acetyl-beta-D-mannosaminyltransferase
MTPDLAAHSAICNPQSAFRGNPPVSLFGMRIDPLTMSEAVEEIYGWVAGRGTCRYVVTPNVDHAVLFQRHAGLRVAYAEAGLVLADGMPVLWASRLLRRGLRQRVPGSDLVPALFAAAGPCRPLSVFLLGAGPGVAERAARRIEQRWPHVRVAGTYSPPPGFERDLEGNERILTRIAVGRPDVVIVGLGAPKQELWLREHYRRIAAPAALAVGATIDFLAGEKARAPRWMRRVGLEWAHRLASEPRRLASRYARDAVLFPRLVWQEWRTAP